jgi:hypothetical protein
MDNQKCALVEALPETWQNYTTLLASAHAALASAHAALAALAAAPATDKVLIGQSPRHARPQVGDTFKRCRATLRVKAVSDGKVWYDTTFDDDPETYHHECTQEDWPRLAVKTIDNGAVFTPIDAARRA